MPDTPAPVRAYQLIYTNVEADLSPLRQRGFQVWLSSPELTPEQRRMTAKRLDDFRLPPGAGSQDPTLARHVFFHLADGGYFVIARTVPSAERDKFGRGGKFHAHAVLLGDEAFREVGCDPFRVIDGGFSFHSTPAEAMAADGWRSGNLPQVEIRPAEPATGTAPLPEDRLVELIDHVERADDRAVVIADRPDRVLALLRGWFAAFPPCARRKAEFDTLSTGSSLAQIRYPFVGAFSTDNLKTWAFRRYHRLEPATGACTPTLGASGIGLPAELLRAPGWRAISDAERDATFAAGRALVGGKLEEVRANELTRAAVGVLSGSPGFRPAVDAAVNARVSRDVHPGLAKLPDVVSQVAGHFDGPPGEVLARLAEPIPWKVMAAALYDSLKRILHQPDPDVLAGLGEWLASGKTWRRLELIFRRWRGKDADFAMIERELAEPGEEDAKRQEWFREWLAATLGECTADDLIDRLEPDRTPPGSVLRDARLWLMLHPEPTPATDQLRMLIALHRGPEALAAVLTGPDKPAGADGWLVRVTAARLKDAFKPGWMNDGLGGISLGLFLVPDRPADEVLLDAAVELGPPLAKRLLAAMWPIGSGRFAAPGEAEQTSPEGTAACYKRLLEAEPKDLSATTGRLREHLITTDDEAYRWAGNHLLRKAYGEPVLRAVTNDTYFVGLKLVWVQFDKPSHQLAVFEAVAGAVVPEVTAGETLEVGRSLEARPSRRFSWLLARLADPNGTERMRV
jgi:hypothetical protein